MRSVWKGHIQFSLMTIPVKMFTSIEASEGGIKFNTFHKDCNGAVGHKKYCRCCNKDLATAEIIKGFTYEEGKFVEITDTDLEHVKVKSTKTIELKGFVPQEQVNPALVEATYYLAADGAAGIVAYSVLHSALLESGKLAIGSIFMRDRETPVALTAVEGGIILQKLHFTNEVRKIEECKVELAAPAPAHLALAKQLVDSMTMDFNQIEIKDHYNAALKQVVEAKIGGTELIVDETTAPAPAMDITVMLTLAIEAAKGKKLEAAAEVAPVKTRKRKAIAAA